MRNAFRQSFIPAKYVIAQLSDGMIKISTRVSLQWFLKTKPQIINDDNHTHSVCLFTRSFTVAHEVEAIVMFSQPDEKSLKGGW